MRLDPNRAIEVVTNCLLAMVGGIFLGIMAWYGYNATCAITLICDPAWMFVESAK